MFIQSTAQSLLHEALQIALEGQSPFLFCYTKNSGFALTCVSLRLGACRGSSQSLIDCAD